MPQPQPHENKPHAPQDRPGGVNGLWFIIITLSLFVLVPGIVVGVLQFIPKAPPPEPLDYDQRASWPAQELRSRSLEYDMFVAAETGRRYRKANFPLSDTDEAMLQQAVWLVQQDDFFTNPAHSETLRAWADEHDTQFYPAYLLAEWLRVDGQTQAAEPWRRLAFERATGAIVQHLARPDGTPAAGHTLPPVAIAYDRVIDGELNATLRLIYPAPTADEEGNIYLPTFQSVYRLTDPALPQGAQTGSYPLNLTLLPQTGTRQTPNWFSAPSRVGRLPDATLEAE
ncbi:MAG: hypothetical protein ACIAXF_00920 [Phycisphaerales bacterium JB063]